MKHERMNFTYVGIDSHKDTHYAVILDCFCERLGALEIKNAPSYFDKFIEKLKTFQIENTTLTFGFEDTSEYGTSLVKYLINNSFEVRHCNASLVASERNSSNVLHKTDDFDAECVTRILITKYKTLPVCSPKDEYLILKQLVTRRDYIVKNYTGLKRQFHRMIAKNYPAYKSFFYVVDCPSALTFFQKYPSPSTLKDENEVLDFLNNNTKMLANKKDRVDKMFASIKTDGDTTTDYQATNDFIIKSIIRQMVNCKEEIKLVEEKIIDALKYIPQKLQTIKGINYIATAQIIAEIGDISRFNSPSKLARYAGVAPVTYSSGKSMFQFANEKGNRNLSSILFFASVTLSTSSGRNKTPLNPIFSEYYKKKISEGKTKKQALKCVQRRLINIIYSMLKNNTEYIIPDNINEKTLEKRLEM